MRVTGSKAYFHNDSNIHLLPCLKLTEKNAISYEYNINLNLNYVDICTWLTIVRLMYNPHSF